MINKLLLNTSLIKNDDSGNEDGSESDGPPMILTLNIGKDQYDDYGFFPAYNTGKVVSTTGARFYINGYSQPTEWAYFYFAYTFGDPIIHARFEWNWSKYKYNKSMELKQKIKNTDFEFTTRWDTSSFGSNKYSYYATMKTTSNMDEVYDYMSTQVGKNVTFYIYSPDGLLKNV